MSTDPLPNPETPPLPQPSAELIRWQRRLLPFLTWFMVGLAAAFFAFAVLDIIQVRSYVEGTHSANISELIRRQIDRQPAASTKPADIFQQSLLLLEADTLEKRYHQASGLLMSRVWTKHLAFITGMVLAFLGATFILARLSESPTNLSGAAAEWKVQVSTASPGIVLCLFGTILLVTSLVVETKIEVRDVPVYLPAGTLPAVKPPPAEISDLTPKESGKETGTDKEPSPPPRPFAPAVP